jgi:hypothetical protein
MSTDEKRSNAIDSKYLLERQNQESEFPGGSVGGRR